MKVRAVAATLVVLLGATTGGCSWLLGVSEDPLVVVDGADGADGADGGDAATKPRDAATGPRDAAIADAAAPDSADAHDD